MLKFVKCQLVIVHTTVSVLIVTNERKLTHDGTIQIIVRMREIGLNICKYQVG